MISSNEFASTVLAWQQQHGRHDLPWQQNATPYRVLVSEIMLQQTQVATVIPYFQRWMEHFPTLNALADAEENQVMAVWQGLGYYSRARNLQKAARYITHELNGEFPETLTALEKIPGVGRYTAGAICSFAYNTYGPIVDGNVRRLFCRLFAIAGQATSSAVNKKLWAYAEALTPQQHNRAFAQGLLDLGATLCKARTPECHRCPFAEQCQAYQQDAVAEYPTPKLKKVLPEKTGHFLLHANATGILVVKRPNTGIWASLWCLPELAEPPHQANKNAIATFTHTFSHYKLHATVWQTSATLAESAASYGQQQLLNSNNIGEFGLPAPFAKLLPKLLAKHLPPAK